MIRWINLAVVGVLALALSGFAAAQGAATGFPAKPVRIVVPFPPGGVADGLARALAQELAKAWGQQVLVENRSGANTIIGAEAVAKAPADGYTLLMASDSTLSINPALYAKLPYDPVKDFVPVAQIAQTIELLVANPSLPANTVVELVALARQKPGTINYGSFGPGSTPHLSTEAFKSAAGIDLVHVPFKGVAEIMPALMADQIQVVFASIATPLPHIRAGKLKALGIVAKQRSPLLPEVPTFAESGFAEFDSKAWFGFVAPAGTPRDIVRKLALDIDQVVSTPQFRERYIVAVGLEPLSSSPEAFAEFLKTDRERYARKVKTANVRLD